MRDLNDLQFFATVVKHRSFSGAARVLGVPKSRVSRRVALLEERLGVRLLERSTRSLNVTEVGQQVCEHARSAIDEAEAAGPDQRPVLHDWRSHGHVDQERQLRRKRRCRSELSHWSYQAWRSRCLFAISRNTRAAGATRPPLGCTA
jgi:molybdenum-dependent DNA-binding transcriptional regulator ModE